MAWEATSLAAALYARGQWATETTLCAATCQLTIELMERGSWDTQIGEVAIRAGKRSAFTGLCKEPVCGNPQCSGIAVLNWHAVMFSGRFLDPPSDLPVFYVFILYCWEGRGISSNKGNQARLRKKKNTKVPISLKWFINYGSKIFTQHSPQWLSHMYQHACGGAGDKTTVLILVLTPGPSLLPNTNSKNHQKVLVTPTTGYFKPH